MVNDIAFDPTLNIWELVPQLRYYVPYSGLYDRDSSKEKEKSSLEMWCVIFMGHPDEDKNIYYRMSPEERKKMLKETLCTFIEWEDPLIEKCIESFPNDCLTSIQKSLKIELDVARKRALLLDKTEYTLENAKALNVLQKDALKVYENYEKIKEKFLEEKAQIRAKGGRRLSKAEKGELWSKK